MATARHRRPTRNPDQPPHNPQQALTPLQALQAMALNPAHAAHQEHTTGQLRTGHRADLPVLLTVVDGRPTHRHPSL